MNCSANIQTFIARSSFIHSTWERTERALQNAPSPLGRGRPARALGKRLEWGRGRSLKAMYLHDFKLPQCGIRDCERNTERGIKDQGRPNREWRDTEMFYFVSTFNFNLNNFGTREEALKHYLEYHVPLAKRMPGLRKYIIGPVTKTRGGESQYERCAILVFESYDALRDAYSSEIGKELRKDEEILVGDYRVYMVQADEIV